LLNAAGNFGVTGLRPWARADDGPLETSWRLIASGPEHLVAQAVVRNTGAAPARLRSILWSTGFMDGHALVAPEKPVFFATENFRGDYFGTGTCFGDRYFAPWPNHTVELGWSEDQVFPGLFITAGESSGGLLCAAASQRRFHLLYRLRGRDGQNRWFFEIEERPTGLDGVTVAPGASVEGEQIFFGWTATADPQAATGEFYRVLRANGAFARRAVNPLPAQRIWCSWNYDFFDRITEGDVLRQLPVLRQHFPGVRFIQIDDGYQRCLREGARAMIDLVYDGVEPFDPVKFPSGAKGTADKIKAAGYRPALWLGLWASLASRMMQEHPDWVLRDEAGRPLIFDKWYGGTCVLDLSVPEAREYLERLCHTVFQEWGYEGVKLDFSTFAFEAKRIRYRHGARTALEWKQWLVETFRRYLPVDGFFGWCVVGGTGSPFAGGAADYFRAALDIGRGRWEMAPQIAAWMANTNMLLQDRPVLPNIDSLGVSAHLTPVEQQTWLDLGAISGAALEISGDLTKHPPAALAQLNRALELSDPDRRVRCLDVPAGAFALPPALWLAEGQADSLLALFNWSDAEATLSLPARFHGRAATDVNTNETQALGADQRLPAHGSRLLRLKEFRCAQGIVLPAT
jgi:hypothetical protein